jgi:hypothetical protein
MQPEVVWNGSEVHFNDFEGRHWMIGDNFDFDEGERKPLSWNVTLVEDGSPLDLGPTFDVTPLPSYERRGSLESTQKAFALLMGKRSAELLVHSIPMAILSGGRVAVSAS